MRSGVSMRTARTVVLPSPSRVITEMGASSSAPSDCEENTSAITQRPMSRMACEYHAIARGEIGTLVFTLARDRQTCSMTAGSEPNCSLPHLGVLTRRIGPRQRAGLKACSHEPITRESHDVVVMARRHVHLCSRAGCRQCA